MTTITFPAIYYCNWLPFYRSYSFASQTFVCFAQNIILIIIVVLFLLFIAFSIIYNKFQDYIIRINEVEGKIDEAIREKFDIIIKLNNIIKEKIKTKKVLVDDISKLKDKKISSFEIDRKLVEALNKINFVKSQYTELETDEDVIKLTYDIEDIDESLRAFKKFYEHILECNDIPG